MKIILKSFPAILLFVVASMLANAQQVYKNFEAAKIVNGTNKVIISKQRNSISYASPDEQTAVSDKDAVNWLKQNVLHCNTSDNFQ
jgi:hypothetical protein